MSTIDKNEIKTIVATVNNFPPSQENKLLQNAVVYFCESHNKSTYERYYVRSTTDILHRYAVELSQCEKYELRTGYLSRWNYMPKDIEQMSSEEIEEAIKKGYEEENDWLKRCEPSLPESFIAKDWKACISEKENPYYQQCKGLLEEELERNKNFYDSFVESVNTYAKKHNSNPNNGWKYVLEEIVWVFSLPLVHPNKYIYLIHVGKANPALKQLFNVFPNFAETAKWIRPAIKEANFKNDADFLMYYNANRNVGCSYAVDNRNMVNPFMRTIIEKSHSPLEIESLEKTLMRDIIEKLPCHVYWLNRENVYLGCNGEQAKAVGLKSAKEVVGKTNFDFWDSCAAKELNDINEFVMSTGKSYEVQENGYFLGEHRDCLSKKVPLFNTLGKVIGLLGVSFDVTQKKKVEELENKLKMREELYKVAKEVSHDIASPVLTLKIVEQIYDGKVSEKDKRMLSLAIASIENMARKMLTKYRIDKNIEIGEREAVVDKIEEKYICPYVSLPDIVEKISYRNKEANVEIKCEVDKGNKFVFIKGESGNFEQMMLNIINNGIESLEGKKAEIEIRYEVSGEEVEIKVKDNGKGMPKEMAEKLEKGEEIGTTKKEGHGIGTQQIRDAMKTMNGKIKIESREGIGTEFILTFPKSEKPTYKKDKPLIKKQK